MHFENHELHGNLMKGFEHGALAGKEDMSPDQRGRSPEAPKRERP